MVKISKNILVELIEEGFFDKMSSKSVKEVVDRLSEKGYTISGRKASLLGQLLTYLCRDKLLVREKGDDNQWRYKLSPGAVIKK